MPKFTLPIEKIDLEDRDSIGSMFANLFYLRSSSPTTQPSGFFITKLGFDETLSSHWDSLVSLLSVDHKSPEKLQRAKSILENKLELPKQLQVEISQKAKQLKKPFALTSNLIFPDETEALSFTGIANSEKDLFENIRHAYLSFLQPTFVQRLEEASSFREISIVLQIVEKKLPETSGEATGHLLNKNQIHIDSLWGEFSQNFDKDTSLINKQDLSEESYTVSQQKEQIAFIKGRYQTLSVAESYQNQRKLSLESCLQIAKVLKRIETQTAKHVSLKFFTSRNRVYITEVLLDSGTERVVKEAVNTIINLPLLSSLKPVFPGLTSGVGKLINNRADLAKLRQGEIAIVNSVEKESLPLLKKASGIIINSSQNLQEAQKSLIRKLGIASAIGRLGRMDQNVITLDSRFGRVYQGAFSPTKAKELPVKDKPVDKVIKTATKVFATIPYLGIQTNLDLSECDSVGPLRLEGFNLKTRAQAANFVTQVCTSAQGKSVLLQLSLEHPNPTEHLTSQLDLVREVRNKSSFKNLSISLPATKRVSEQIDLKKLLSAKGLHRSPTFKVFATIDSSTSIFSLEELIEISIDGLVVDYWSLVNHMYQESLPYSELVRFKDTAVDHALAEIFTLAKRRKIFTLVSNFPVESADHLVAKLVNLSASAVAVNWQSVATLRQEIHSAEANLIKSKS